MAFGSATSAGSAPRSTRRTGTSIFLPLRVSGIGFFENDVSWLPWWEAAFFAGRAVSFGAVGFELAGAAQRDHAVTRDGLVSQAIPMVRLGIAGTLRIP